MSAEMFTDDKRYARMIDIVIEKETHWHAIVGALNDCRKLLRTPLGDEEEAGPTRVCIGSSVRVCEWFMRHGFVVEGTSAVFR